MLFQEKDCYKAWVFQELNWKRFDFCFVLAVFVQTRDEDEH